MFGIEFPRGGAARLAALIMNVHRYLEEKCRGYLLVSAVPLVCRVCVFAGCVCVIFTRSETRPV